MPRTPLLADPVEELSTQLVTLVRGLKQLHVAIIDAGAHPMELTAFTLLARLADLSPARPSVVASALCLDLSTVSRQITALERAGWVARTVDPDDGRAQLLELSPAGQTVLEDIRRSRADVLASLLPDWDPTELHAFAAQLSRFNTAVTTRNAATTEERA